MADAPHADGVLHRIAAALDVAADVQAGDDIPLGACGVALGEGVAVLVALQAAHADQHGGRAPLAGVVGGIFQGKHPGSRFAEVVVRAGMAELVVPLDGSQSGLQRFALKAALGQQLFQGIGLELIGLGLGADLGVLTVGEVGVGLVLILGDDVAQAAVVGRHVGDLLAPVGVVDLEGGALGLELDLVFQLLAGDALVHEPLAPLVQLEEGGHAHAAAHVVGHGCMEILNLTLVLVATPLDGSSVGTMFPYSSVII